jgi:hypothetical protein
MADPTAVILRFNGDPDDLLQRFEQARRLWIEAQDGDYERPAFYAARKTDAGIVVLSGWETGAAHQAFGHRMRPHLEAVGMGGPTASSGCRSTSSAGTEPARPSS